MHLHALVSLFHDSRIPLPQTSQQIDVGRTIGGYEAADKGSLLGNGNEFPEFAEFADDLPMDCDVPEAFGTIFNM